MKRALLFAALLGCRPIEPERERRGLLETVAEAPHAGVSVLPIEPEPEAHVAVREPATQGPRDGDLFGHQEPPRNPLRDAVIRAVEACRSDKGELKFNVTLSFRGDEVQDVGARPSVPFENCLRRRLRGWKQAEPRLPDQVIAIPLHWDPR
jgi:hypothetical protein